MVVVRGNRVEEFDFESANRKQLRGNIYLAKVTRVEPSLQAAFVEYGGNRHGFVAFFSEIHPDYYQIPVADRQAIGPMELLVLPKMLALMIALPLLTVFTDVTGILGGMVMARAHLGVSFSTFINRLDDAISLTSYLIGIGKAPVFAVIISLVGCYQGFQVSGSADSVGRQTTVSVVQSIFLVIVTDSLFSIVFSALEI